MELIVTEDRKEKIVKRLTEIDSNNLLETGGDEIQSEVTNLVYQLAFIHQDSISELEKENVYIKERMDEAADIMQDLVNQNKLLKMFIEEQGLMIKYQWFALKMTK